MINRCSSANLYNINNNNTGEFLGIHLMSQQCLAVHVLMFYSHIQMYNYNCDTPVCLCAGNYRTQLYDKQKEEYLPATQGLGMFVEVKDPDDKVSPEYLTLLVNELNESLLSVYSVLCTHCYHQLRGVEQIRLLCR